MDRTGLEFPFCLSENKSSSHCHLDNIHGRGASPLRLPVYLRPPIHEDATVLGTITERHGERTFLELRWQMQPVTQ